MINKWFFEYYLNNHRCKTGCKRMILVIQQIEETENAIASLGKNKISISTQLEDTKKLGDAEARDRASLLSKFKNLTTEVWQNVKNHQKIFGNLNYFNIH